MPEYLEKDLDKELKELRRTGIFIVTHARPMYIVHLSGTPFEYHMKEKRWLNLNEVGKWEGGNYKYLVYETEEVLEYLKENRPSIVERLIFNLDLLG